MALRPEFLHNRIDSTPFRAVLSPPSASSRLAIEVIGWQIPWNEATSSHEGMAAWFLYWLDQPAEIGEPSRKKVTDGPAMVLHPPHVPIHHRPLAQPCCRSWIRFSGGLIPALVKAEQLPLNQPIPLPDPARFAVLLAELYLESTAFPSPDPQTVEWIMRLWLRRLAQLVRPGENRETLPKLQMIRRYLETHYAERITLEDLAKRFHVSRSWLTQQFRIAYQMAPIAYLHTLRLSQAVDLLVDTDLTQEVIAQRCGLRDASYLCRFFKSRTGQVPGSLRVRGQSKIAKLLADDHLPELIS